MALVGMLYRQCGCTAPTVLDIQKKQTAIVVLPLLCQDNHIRRKLLATGRIGLRPSSFGNAVLGKLPLIYRYGGEGNLNVVTVGIINIWQMSQDVDDLVCFLESDE